MNNTFESPVVLPCCFNFLAVETVGNILGYAKTPKASRVCQLWHQISNDSRITLVLFKERTAELGIEQEMFHAQALALPAKKVQLLRDGLLAKVKPFLSDTQILHLSKLEQSYPVLMQLLFFEKDKNFLIAFEAIASQVPTLKELFSYQDFLILSTFQKAAKLRAMLSEIQEELMVITEIDLNSKGLTLIPEELNFLKAVTQVKLAFNKIKKIPSDFGTQWTHLRELHLNDNQIAEIPQGFGKAWKEIQKVFLYSNKLTALPIDFGALWSTIKSLLLHRNQIQSLPNNIGENWQEITEVNLSRNQLNTLPADFGSSWKQLMHLDLTQNKAKLQPANNMIATWPELLISRL